MSRVSLHALSWSLASLVFLVSHLPVSAQCAHSKGGGNTTGGGKTPGNSGVNPPFPTPQGFSLTLRQRGNQPQPTNSQMSLNLIQQQMVLQQQWEWQVQMVLLQQKLPMLVAQRQAAQKKQQQQLKQQQAELQDIQRQLVQIELRQQLAVQQPPVVQPLQFASPPQAFFGPGQSAPVAVQQPTATDGSSGLPVSGDSGPSLPRAVSDQPSSSSSAPPSGQAP